MMKVQDYPVGSLESGFRSGGNDDEVVKTHF